MAIETNMLRDARQRMGSAATDSQLNAQRQMMTNVRTATAATGTALNSSGGVSSGGAAPAPRTTTATGQQPTYGQYSDEQVRGMQSTFAQARSAGNLRDQMPGYKPLGYQSGFQPSRMQMEASKIPGAVPYRPTPGQLEANRANAMGNYNPAQFARQMRDAQIREKAYRANVGVGEGLGRR